MTKQEKEFQSRLNDIVDASSDLTIWLQDEGDNKMYLQYLKDLIEAKKEFFMWFKKQVK